MKFGEVEVILEEKWIPKKLKKGALHRDLGIPDSEKIPSERLETERKRLKSKIASGTATEKDKTTYKRVNLAKTFSKINKEK